MRKYLILVVIIAALIFLVLKPGKEETKIPQTSAELKTLLAEVGPEKAQEIMFHSGLPFTGQTHLLIHTVGDYIYKQYGEEGLKYCKDYFLSACYHAFILNTLADHGMEGMIEVMKSCWQAGNNVAPQCAHGAGHGFVAWHDYDLLKALKMCDALGEKSENFPHFNCYDGVFMENFWGVHNGAPSPKRWISETDLSYPCDDPRIESKYLNACWGNQATRAYQYFQGDLSRTATFCDSVPNPTHRDFCYNNLGRQIHPLTAGDVSKVFSLCAVATGTERQNECVMTNVLSYWSVGDKELPRKICAAAEEPLRSRCFARIQGLQ